MTWLDRAPDWDIVRFGHHEGFFDTLFGSRRCKVRSKLFGRCARYVHPEGEPHENEHEERW